MAAVFRYLCLHEVYEHFVQSVQQGATCPYRIVQRDIILNNMQSLVNEMYTVVKRISEDENYQLLRFVVCGSVKCIM